MKTKVQRNRKQKSWRRQGVGLLCCLLSFIWFGIPSFHSFCHFADLPHQHPSGSAFSHDHGHSHDDHDHSHGDHSHSHDNHGHSHDDHSHDLLKSSLAGSENAADSASEPNPGRPYREPGDNEGPVFTLQLLESETCCSAPNSLFLNQACPALDEANFHRIGFFSSAELGTIGARGPPISLDSFFFQLV